MKPCLLFLTASDQRGASSRYRVFQYVRAIEKSGFLVQILPPSKTLGRGIARLWSSLVEQWAILKAARNADVIFIQKRLFSGRFVRQLSSLGKPLVFDFDDAIFTSPQGNWSNNTKRRVCDRLSAILSISDTVITGNSFLREYAASFSRRVEVLPTVVNIEHYRLKNHQPSDTIVLGWIGHSVNHPYLQNISEVLSLLSSKFPSVCLLVISDIDFYMPGVRVENRRWSESSEIKDLLDMDIGLMPLTPDEWSRGKCALKAIQYMASGLPVVCSAVGANRDVVRDGVDGYLVSSDGQWLDALSSLIASLELRRSFGISGRQRAIDHFSLSAVVPQMVSLLQDLVIRKHDSKSSD